MSRLLQSVNFVCMYYDLLPFIIPYYYYYMLFINIIEI